MVNRPDSVAIRKGKAGHKTALATYKMVFKAFPTRNERPIAFWPEP